MGLIFTPSIVEQVRTDDREVSWVSYLNPGNNYLLQSRWKTERDLVHYANLATGDQRTKTVGLRCTGFNIPTYDRINGIQLRVIAQRQGRIVDETVQLTYNGGTIGKNNFVYRTDSEGHLKLTNDTVYGSDSDLWEADLTPAVVSDLSFGVLLRFQSHPYYPHKQTMYLDSVFMEVFYE